MSEEITNEQEVNQEKEVKVEKSNKKEKVKELELEVASLTDKLLRNMAELENFKKRINDERVKDRKYATMNLVGDLIDIVDNFNKVCDMETKDETLKNFLYGFRMFATQLLEILNREGLEEIKCNEKFDPNLHHAVSVDEDKDKEDGCILEILNKGYKYKDRILRPTMVKVNKIKENDQNE